MLAMRDMNTEAGRREAVLEAMGSFALEGMLPSAATVDWARDYIAGRLSLKQILEQLKRKYGVGLPPQTKSMAGMNTDGYRVTPGIGVPGADAVVRCRGGCGRTLTSPRSIARGFGASCWHKRDG